MIFNPGQSVRPAFVPRGYLKNNRVKLLLGICQHNAIQRKKHKHNMNSQSFISIYHCMISNKTISQASRLFLYLRISFKSVISLKRCGKC